MKKTRWKGKADEVEVNGACMMKDKSWEWEELNEC